MRPRVVGNITVLLFASASANSDITSEEQIEDTSFLKRDGDIILQPQPSDSPNDPLNWYELLFDVIELFSY
jgi:hypothetical protein